MGDEPDLDPEISRSFFEGNVLKLDPSLLTENGIRFVIQNKFTVKCVCQQISSSFIIISAPSCHHFRAILAVRIHPNYNVAHRIGL